jgi:hypothetical protein
MEFVELEGEQKRSSFDVGSSRSRHTRPTISGLLSGATDQRACLCSATIPPTTTKKWPAADLMNAQFISFYFPLAEITFNRYACVCDCAEPRSCFATLCRVSCGDYFSDS